MEFMLMALVGLTLLGLSTVCLVEVALLIGRMYTRFSSWYRSRGALRQSGRQVRALKRRYGPAKEKSQRGKCLAWLRQAAGRDPRTRLGALRFNKSRAVAFSGHEKEE